MSLSGKQRDVVVVDDVIWSWVLTSNIAVKCRACVEFAYLLACLRFLKLQVWIILLCICRHKRLKNNLTYKL